MGAGHGLGEGWDWGCTWRADFGVGRKNWGWAWRGEGAVFGVTGAEAEQYLGIMLRAGLRK